MAKIIYAPKREGKERKIWLKSFAQYKEWKECVDYHHNIVSVEVIEPLVLRVTFDDGKVTRYHVIDTARKSGGYIPDNIEILSEAPELFNSMKVTCWDVDWTEDIGLGCEELYHSGEELVPPRAKNH